MLKKNKGKLLFSSVIILLPIVFGCILWDTLPASMVSHWGVDGQADGIAGKAFAVFGLPLLLLLGHFICLFCTSLDKRQNEQNPKALGIVFWILPIVSLFVNGLVYTAALREDFRPILLTPALLGVLFLLIGNYLPKTKQNSTLGIKLSWTLQNEENWNKTHRFSGKIWVAGGLVMLFSVFLPSIAMLVVCICAVLVMTVLPIGYSYRLYAQHRKAGVAYVLPPKSKAEKIALRITAVVVPLLLLGVAVLMFTGHITVDCGDTSLRIAADYWDDLEIPYDTIDTVAYSEHLDPGIRTCGFASARLSMGLYQNDAFGSYTRYAYTGAKEFIVLTSGKKTLVLGLKDPAETQALYTSLLEKTGK